MATTDETLANSPTETDRIFPSPFHLTGGTDTPPVSFLGSSP